MCVHTGRVGSGELMFDDKFVYVNIVCFAVVILNLNENRNVRAYGSFEKKGALKLHSYYYY